MVNYLENRLTILFVRILFFSCYYNNTMYLILSYIYIYIYIYI